jgi:uncharacterized protein YjgD (DUF1641 family)
MIKNLIKLANHLDSRGLTDEANSADACIKEAKQKMQDWAVANMSPERIADLAEKMPSEKLYAIVKAMDPRKKQEIMNRLVKDPEIQRMALAALGLPTSMTGVAGSLVDEISNIMDMQGGGADLGKDTANVGGDQAVPTLDDLKGLFLAPKDPK